MDITLPHGTVLSTEGGRPRVARDRHGNEVWSVRWNGGKPHAVVLRRPDRSAVVVETQSLPHPLFHRAQAIRSDDATVARVGATDWLAPTALPPVDVPAAIPSGGGSAMLNFLATSAARCGEDELRYRGPYPTAALFDALLQSFRVANVSDALERFTRNVEARALRGAMTEVDVPFVPTPFEWHWPRPDVCVQLRQGVERVFVAGRGYARFQHGSRRLRMEGDAVIAYVEIAGEHWADVLRLDARGIPQGDMHELPPAPPDLIGQALPGPIVELLGAVLSQRAPALLQPAIVAVLDDHPLRWADTGDDVARVGPDGLELHSALGERVPDMEPQRMLEAFVMALEPVVSRLAQASTQADELSPRPQET